MIAKKRCEKSFANMRCKIFLKNGINFHNIQNFFPAIAYLTYKQFIKRHVICFKWSKFINQMLA
jgi:hypothetical protein